MLAPPDNARCSPPKCFQLRREAEVSVSLLRSGSGEKLKREGNRRSRFVFADFQATFFLSAAKNGGQRTRNTKKATQKLKDQNITAVRGFSRTWRASLSHSADGIHDRTAAEVPSMEPVHAWLSRAGISPFSCAGVQPGPGAAWSTIVGGSFVFS